MKPGVPWSVKGIEPGVREAAKDAARRSGMTLGEWLNSAILDQADDPVGAYSTQTAGLEKEMSDVRTASPIPRYASETTVRLEDIAHQLSQLARREQESAAIMPYEPARERDNETLTRILNRVESNERQTVEAFTAVNERLSVLGRQIALSSRQKTFEKPEDVPGFRSLETAIRNVVDHIELSENRTRDTLKGMQDRLAEMASRAAGAPSEDLLRAAPSFAALENRIGEIGQRLQQQEIQMQAQSGLPKVVREELSKLAGRIEESRSVPPAYAAMEQRLSDIGQRVQQQEMQAQSGLPKPVRDELSKLANRIEESRAVPPAYTAIEQRLNDIGQRLLHHEAQTQSGLPKAVRDELAKLASRIDEVRSTSHNLAREAQTSAVSAAQKELRDIEGRIHGLLREAQAASGSQGITAADLQRLRGEMATLNHRIDGQLSAAASDKDLQAVRVAVEQLSARVAQGPDMRPLADLDRKLADIAARVEQTQAAARNPPHFAELDRRIGALDRQLQQALSRPQDTGSVVALEQQIAAVNDRLGRTEEQLGHFATIERAISQLYEGLEKSKDLARQTAEDAANRAAERVLQSLPAPVVQDGPSPELVALQEGLRAVRESAQSSDQRNQDTLAAVHETLEQIVGKLTELETSTAGHQLAMNMAQQAATAAPLSLRQAVPKPQAASPQPPAETAFLHQMTPFDPPAPEHAAVSPPEAEAQSGRLATASFSNSEISLEFGGDDYIAAARRLAQAANNAPPAAPPLTAGSRPGAAPAAAGSRFKLPFEMPKLARRPKPITFSGGKLVTEEMVSAKPLSRRTLVLVGLALLMAAGLFGARMMMKPAQPLKQSSAIESTIAPASKPVALASVGGPQKTDQSIQIVTPLVDTDNLITGSLPARKTEASLSAIVAQPGNIAEKPEIPPVEIGSQSLRDAAARGDPTAQFIVASRYLDGDHVQQDFTRAAYWYQQAASRGLAPAEYRIATLFERGKGVPQDSATALLWYERAAEAGNTKAMHNAAVLAAGNQAGTPNYDKAFRWFGEAAKRGLKDSQFNLAVLYERGLGTKVDAGTAYVWYRLAAKQGDSDAGARADVLKKTLAAAVLATAEQSLAAWQPVSTTEDANVVAVAQPDWNAPADAMVTQPAAPQAASPGAVQSPARPESSSADPVRTIQQLLQKLGYNVGTPDGHMGTRTASAIRLFQLQSGMRVTGEVTPELISEMRSKAAG